MHTKDGGGGTNTNTNNDSKDTNNSNEEEKWKAQGQVEFVPAGTGGRLSGALRTSRSAPPGQRNSSSIRLQMNFQNLQNQTTTKAKSKDAGAIGGKNKSSSSSSSGCYSYFPETLCMPCMFLSGKYDKEDEGGRNGRENGRGDGGPQEGEDFENAHQITDIEKIKARVRKRQAIARAISEGEITKGGGIGNKCLYQNLSFGTLVWGGRFGK